MADPHFQLVDYSTNKYRGMLLTNLLHTIWKAKATMFPE